MVAIVISITIAKVQKNIEKTKCFPDYFSIKVLIFSTFLSFFPLCRGIREGLGRKNGSRDWTSVSCFILK